jgi:sugar/nucleoside kinase (ribokinase family)
MTMQYDVYGLGNALVDMEFRVDEGFLRHHGISKGHMTLVPEERLDALTAALSDYRPERMSGGSAANTIIAVQGFGGRTFYSCRLAGDDTGQHFLSDLGTAGVATNRNALADISAGKSGRCLVLVTPDAERSMNTFLGISSALNPADIDEAALATSRFFYAEGYLSSGAESLAAAIAARELAETSGVHTAVSLSDSSMVAFFRDNLTLILGNGIDLLFCNEEEALAWASTDRMDIAVRELREIGRMVYITLGKAGSLVVSAHDLTRVDGFSARAVDTNGAGDIFAGACLYGWCAGFDPVACASFGNFAAARLVATYGARFRQIGDYRQLIAEFRSGVPVAVHRG